MKVLTLTKPADILQFTREALMLSQSAHPNLVKVVDFDSKHTPPYLVMPLAAKGSLGGEIKLRKQRGEMMPLARTVQAIEQVGDALAYLHQKLIVHQDVKPDNILLPDDYNFWLSDLGIARELNPLVSLKTQQPEFSPHFASPEQENGKAILASDQYSLAITAFLLLTGRLPFEGQTIYQLWYQHQTQPPPSLVSVVNAGQQGQRMMAVLRALDPVIQKALSKKPGNRYQSVTIFTRTFTITAEGAAQEKLTGKHFQMPMPTNIHLLPTNQLTRMPAALTATLPVIGQLVKRCVALLEEEKYVELLQVSERIIALNPMNADGWFYKGLALCRFGKWQETLEPYDRVLQIDPANVEAMRNMADSLNRLDRHTEALVLLEKALLLDPTFTVALNDKGAALRKLGRTEEALAAYDQAININSQYSEAYNNKGVVLHALGRTEEALAAYDQAIRINPKYSNAYHNKGDVLYALGRTEEALAAYDQAIRFNPKNSQACYNKGVVLRALGRTEEALAAYDQAIRINSQYSEAYSNKGNVLHTLGRTEEALTAYDQAIRFNPKDIAAYVNKGYALCTLGRVQEAEICFQQALKYNPSEQIIRLIEQLKKKYQIS